MASARGSPPSSEKCYDSELFILTDEERRKCVELLQCSQTKSKTAKNYRPNRYTTCTSHWVKKAQVSTAAYTLLKIIRWYLLDETSLFDPLKQNKKGVVKLTAQNVLWPSFDDTDEIGVSVSSVDAILASNLSDVQIKALDHLDNLMENVDCKNQKGLTAYEADVLAKTLNRSVMSAENFLQDSYVDFISCVAGALDLQHDEGSTVMEMAFEEMFIALVKCLMACVRVDQKCQIRCNRNIDGLRLDKVLLPIAMDCGEEIHLEISSKPDICLYERMSSESVIPRTLIAVVEAKGLMTQMNKGVVNQTILDSDEDGGGEPVVTGLTRSFKKISFHKPKCINHLHSSPECQSESDEIGPKCSNHLHRSPKCQSELDEIDEGEIETDLEKLTENKPSWLERIGELPPDALKAVQSFLPQLIGEMWFCTKSKRVRWFSSKSDMTFGIGLVGFDVYFVTMIDSCDERSSKFDLNDSDNTNVFITRPFNLLTKKDRRIIVKTIVAAFYLNSSRFI